MTSKLPIARGSSPVSTELKELDLSRWPRWIAEALAYKPESPPAVVDASTNAISQADHDRRNIRVLSRMPTL